MVNPLGTVTTITESPEESINAANEFTEAYSSGAYIHENCDESMFRPYVAVISGTIDSGKDGLSDDQCQRPTPIGQKLIVPVIDGTESIRQTELARREEFDRRQEDTIAKFEQMSMLNKKDKAKNAEYSNKVKGNKTGNSRDGNGDNSNSGSKENKPGQPSLVTKSDNTVMNENQINDVPPPAAPQKTKETKSFAAIVEPVIAADDVPEIVTIKIGKKSSKMSAKFNEETAVAKSDLKATSTSASIETKPLLGTLELKKAEEIKVPNIVQKNTKTKSTESPPKEDITLITDDVLNDEDVQPIIESAKITLSDIMRADAKRKEEKEKQRDTEKLKEKHKEKEKSPVSLEPGKKMKNRKCSIDDDTENKAMNIKPEPRSSVVVEDNTMKMPPTEELGENQPKTISDTDNNKSKKANRKQKKLEKLAAEAARVSPPSDSPPLSKSETTEFTFILKKNSISSESSAAPIEFVDASESSSSSSSSSTTMSKIKSTKTDDNDDIAILENFDKTLTGDFTHIQDSLLNPIVSATISVRKPSIKERADSEEKPVILTKKEKKKNAKNKESDTSDTPLTNIKSDANLSDPECSFVEPIETMEPDSLSFKSTTDDPVSLINFESPIQESINPSVGAKLIFDDTESNADGQFSDCKSFDLVADEQPLNALKQSDTVSSFDLVMDDAYTQLKQSDTNSSDETEDSSQGKNVKTTKIHEDDEELQPLISSTTNLQIDTTPDITIQKIIDALPDETNQSDSTKHQQSNKKKSRKKRR